LTNLIMNAVDACEREGTITVRARPDDDQVVLEVVDDGHGMTEEVRARCLEPFFTTKQDRGTGLGLPMVYGIVRRHGGTIDIESAPGRGTTIAVRLPRALAQAPRPSGRQAEDGAGPWNVLVVDDEDRIRTVIRGFLAHDGHTVISAGSAAEALACVESRQIDLVVLDLAMPDMSGDRLATLIRDRAPSIRILMLSGFGAAPAAGALMPDVDGILAKPIRLEDLRSGIARVMSGGPNEARSTNDATV
jgi:CheY-like chemotaxis protein